MARILSRKLAVRLSAAAAAAFLLGVTAASQGGPAAGRVEVRARHADSTGLLTGRDDKDRLPSELLPGQKVNINTAAAQELRLLPGIGEVLSQAIVDYREANGPFESKESLMQVPGIGPGRYAAVAEIITIGENFE